VQYSVSPKNHTVSGLNLQEMVEHCPTNIFSIYNDYIRAPEGLKDGCIL